MGSPGSRASATTARPRPTTWTQTTSRCPRHRHRRPRHRRRRPRRRRPRHRRRRPHRRRRRPRRHRRHPRLRHRRINWATTSRSTTTRRSRGRRGTTSRPNSAATSRPNYHFSTEHGVLCRHVPTIIATATPGRAEVSVKSTRGTCSHNVVVHAMIRTRPRHRRRARPPRGLLLWGWATAGTPAAPMRGATASTHLCQCKCALCPPASTQCKSAGRPARRPPSARASPTPRSAQIQMTLKGASQLAAAAACFIRGSPLPPSHLDLWAT